MLDAIFQRAQRLRPNAVLAPVPEQPGTVRRARDRDAIVEVVSGLFWQRLLLSEPLDAAFVRRVIALVRRIR